MLLSAILPVFQQSADSKRKIQSKNGFGNFVLQCQNVLYVQLQKYLSTSFSGISTQKSIPKDKFTTANHFADIRLGGSNRLQTSSTFALHIDGVDYMTLLNYSRSIIVIKNERGHMVLTSYSRNPTIYWYMIHLISADKCESRKFSGRITREKTLLDRDRWPPGEGPANRHAYSCYNHASLMD